ncbi:MAG: leucyl aminopeptidase [Vampirovibrionia bacterium]
MQVKVLKGSLPDIECDALIVNLFDDVKEPSGGTGAVNNALGHLIVSEAIEADEFKAKLGSVYVLPSYGKIPARKVLVVGLGKREEFDINAVRKVSAEAIKTCKSLKAKKVCTILHGVGIAQLPVKLAAQALTEGALLANYSYEEYKSKKVDNDEEPKKQIEELIIVECDETKLNDIEEGIKVGELVASATNMARDLATEPAMSCTPSRLADLASSLGLQCNVYGKEDIINMGMNSFLGVSLGSAQEPKFIEISYKPESTPVKKVALVGKGITFDSGGLNLKPATGMMDMKKDMSGAAAVLSVMKAVKELKPNCEIVAIIPACENMPSGTSYKQGDVLKAKNGKTIEVTNTDAEGRLILADALCYAVEQQPDEIIDIATLTGAVMHALGSAAASIMGNKQEFIDNFKAASEQSGEKVWQLPLYEEYKEMLKSDLADIQNSASGGAGSSFGGIFLQEFVEKVNWLHLDIAGVAWAKSAKYEVCKGSTGFGVRSILYYILSL